MKKTWAFPWVLAGFLALGFCFGMSTHSVYALDGGEASESTPTAEEQPATNGDAETTSGADDGGTADGQTTSEPSNEGEGPDTDDPAAQEWDVSKSKEATELDENDRTEVTLSLPSSEENLASDIVFVVDNSSCKSATINDAVQLVDDLYAQVQNDDGTKIKIAIVVFKGNAKVTQELVELSADNVDAIKALIREGYKNPPYGGTNIQDGLLRAEELLQADAEVTNTRKHVILVTDGLTRLWTSEDGTVMDIYYQLYKNSAQYWGESSSWSVARGVKEGSYGIPGGDWDAYMAQVEEWVAADGDSYAYPFNGTNIYYGAPSEDFVYVPYGEKEHALSMDRAIFEALKQWRQMAENYHVYAVKSGSNSPLTVALIDAMNNGETMDFAKVGKDILYLLGRGSKVVGVIGEDFDLYDLGSFNLVVTGVDGAEKAALTKTVNGSTIEFANADGVVEFTIDYDADGESFTWNILRNISNFERVSLSYILQLVNKATEAGEYSVPTNEVATLYPVDSEGNEREAEDFEQPFVSYVVEEEEPGKGGDDEAVPTEESAAEEVVADGSNPKTADVLTTESYGMLLSALGVLVAAGSYRAVKNEQ
ncbi:VWA domain-containing protein [Candidatus Saccharibacteria bacterium]|nr:VWA domain-containing protein [Candidatus Saccharibacteria bacterium]